MRRTATVLFVIANLCLLVCGAYNTEFFNGRSGDIVIQENNIVNEDSFVLLKGRSFASMEVESMADTQFGDLVAHVMGTQPFNVEASRTGFPQDNLFDKPSLNLLFVVDGIGYEEMTGSQLLEHGKVVRVQNTFFPAHSVSELSTLLTGRSPAQHGIVAPQWKSPADERVVAHHNLGLPHAASVADVFSQTFTSGLVVAASSSLELAAALGVHPTLVASFIDRQNLGFYYDANTKTFTSTYTGASTHALAIDASSFTIAANPALGITINDNKLVYTYDGKELEFDLADTANAALAAEIAFLYNLIQSDEVLSALNDATPDFLAFGFAAVKAIREAYGQDSVYYHAALKMVAAVMEDVRARLTEGRKTACEMVFLSVGMTGIPRVSTLPRTELQETIYQTVLYSLDSKSDFDEYYPSIYLRHDLPEKKREILCQTLQSKLAGRATVACNKEHVTVDTLNMMRMTRFVLESSSNGTLPTNSTSYAVFTFQLFLWFTIAFIVLLLSAIYAIGAAGTDAAKDSLLYRTMGKHPHSH